MTLVGLVRAATTTHDLAFLLYDPPSLLLWAFALGALVVDAGTRTVLVVTVLTSANFLGVGLEPASADWGVVIQQNSGSLFVAPAAFALPAALLVALCAGANLVADRLLDRREDP